MTIGLTAKVVRESGKYVKHDLTVGEVYDVVAVDMHGFHTNIYLSGMGNVAYNSVIFDFYEDGEEIDIYEDPRYNPYL